MNEMKQKQEQRKIRANNAGRYLAEHVLIYILSCVAGEIGGWKTEWLVLGPAPTTPRCETPATNRPQNWIRRVANQVSSHKLSLNLRAVAETFH